uniref:non-specific serine/threonine protein kinase n=1 Tax=Phallusia mammillata TaxID=59560 RepID=A0A6F9DIW7_9ASCI|nr:serine/threonine-protein kinase LATS1-like [Phallusia mammillata]
MRRADSSASDSSRGRSPRPVSFPNMQHSARGSGMPELYEQMNRVKIASDKKTKRYSLTDSEASDMSASLSSNRPSGSNSSLATSSKGHHQAKLQQIRSNLDQFAAGNNVQQRHVRDLMHEMHVDKDTATRALRDTHSVEAARERVMTILRRKMQQEDQIPNSPNQTYYNIQQPEIHLQMPHRYMYGSHESLAQRGSPDGASSRAESPPLSNSARHHSGVNQYESAKAMQVQKQLVMDQNYNQYPRQFTSDKPVDMRKMPTTLPPSYPGVTATNRHSGSFSPQTSDVGLPVHQSAYHVVSRDGVQANQYNQERLEMSDSGEMGVRQGHVQQMIERMSPGANPTTMSQANGMKVHEAAKSGLSEVTAHQPIIKGSSANSPFFPSNGQSSQGNHPRNPPSYSTAQRFMKISPQNYTPSPPYMEGLKQLPEPMQTASDNRGADSASSAINSALMGNIHQHTHDTSHPMQYHTSAPTNTYLKQNADIHNTRNGYVTVTENPPENFDTVARQPPPSYNQIPRLTAPSSGVKQTMSPVQSQNGSPMDQRHHGNSPQYSDQQFQVKPVSVAHQQRRDPPPYIDHNMPPQASTSVPSTKLVVDINQAKKSGTKPRGGAPSPSSTVADAYIEAVTEKNVILRHPRGKDLEKVKQAAKVTNKRHSGSFSAAPSSKQPNRWSDNSVKSDSSQEQAPSFQVDPSVEKTINTSPVPVRRGLKKEAADPKTRLLSNQEGPDSDWDDGMNTDQEASEEPKLPPLTTRTRRVKKYSPEAYKFYMEQHIENVIKGYKARSSRRWQLEKEMTKFSLPDDTKSEMRKMLFKKESNYIRLKRAKIDLDMFQMIKKIGHGAFGKVMLARNKTSNKLYAIKSLKKKDVLRRNQVAHVKAERDILAEADNDWVVKLYYTFQDKENLYFVMDYIPGGDMMSLLIKKEIFNETLARFYTAELTLALESVHKMGFIHRDIKPDNILIDRDGHIKLTDFGLCTGFRWTHDSKYYQRDGHSHQDSMDFSGEWSGVPIKTLDRRRIEDANRQVARSLVGTPNYIAPEVLLREGYNQLCDWWSVGVILYEMVVGCPPFHSNSPAETQLKVINFKQHLKIPSHARLHPRTMDIIMRLCCDQHERLGSQGGAADVKDHDFFAGINWGTLRQMKSPFIPEIKFSEDTSNFDLPPSGENSTLNLGKCATLNNGTLKLGPGEHAFFEFTFRRFFDEDGRAQSSVPPGYYDDLESRDTEAGGHCSDSLYV